MNLPTLQRFGLLGALYFAQGLPFGFFVQALPVLLRTQGYSLSTIGLMSLLTVPWALKFVWAPVVDTVHWPRLGRRRSWILAMQALSVVLLTLVAVIPGTDTIAVLMGAMLLINLAAATQDIATDGLAVDILPPSERGLANGLQVAGYRVGMIVGGGVLLGLYEQLGHHGLFAAMALLTALASVPVLLASEPRHVETAQAAPRGPHFLSLPGAGSVVALVMLYKLGEAAAQGMIKPFLVDLHYGLSDIAWITGTVGFGAGLLGAIAGGALVGVLGRRSALLLFGACQAVAVAGYAWLAFASPSLVAIYAGVGVEHFASGMATAALFTAMMDWSRPASGGTDYTVQASAVVIATGLANTLGGFVAQAVGYGPYFAGASALCVAAMVGVAVLFPRGPFPSRNSDAAA